MAKNEVKYGEKDLLSADELDPKNAKVSISIRLDGDLILAYKEMAKQEGRGRGYQTLMSEALRNNLAQSESPEPKLLDLWREVKQIRSEVNAIKAQNTYVAIFVTGGSAPSIDWKPSQPVLVEAR